MTVALTTRILGYLIEKGYKFTLARTEENPVADTITITLFPLREKPSLDELPQGYDTYYQITQEPLQMACGVDNTTLVVIELPDTNMINELTANEVLEDSAFRLSEDFYKFVLESLEEYAVFTTDKTGDVSSWNKGAERLLGYSEAEIIGRNAKIFFTEKDQEAREHDKEIASALKFGKGIDERFHVRKDGSVFWGSGLVFPLNDKNHVHRGFTKIMRNLEERREAERNRPETRL